MNWFYCYSWRWDDMAPVGIEQKSWCAFFFFQIQDFKNFNLLGLCFGEGTLLCWLSFSLHGSWGFFMGCLQPGAVKTSEIPFSSTPPLFVKEKHRDCLSNWHLGVSLIAKNDFFFLEKQVFSSLHINTKNSKKEFYSILKCIFLACI